jgi:hypothetical protein
MRAWLVEKVAKKSRVLSLSLMAWFMSRKEQLRLLLVTVEFIKSRNRRAGSERHPNDMEFYYNPKLLDLPSTRCLVYWMYQVLNKDTKENRVKLYREILHFKKHFNEVLPLEAKDGVVAECDAESILAALMICAGAVAKRLSVDGVLVKLDEFYDYILEDGLKILRGKE